MVNHSFSSLRALVGCAAIASLLFLAGCKTPQPVRVDASFTTMPQLAERSPSDIAVMLIEDGTKERTVERHLTYLRQEVMRELPKRLYTPIRPEIVDASLRSQPIAASDSILTPAILKNAAGRSHEDALLAVRVEQWDESTLMTNRRVWFQFQAALVASDGTQLWSGTLAGNVKAGGSGAAPRNRDGAARSCVQLAVRELMLQLPMRSID